MQQPGLRCNLSSLLLERDIRYFRNIQLILAQLLGFIIALGIGRLRHEL